MINTFNKSHKEHLKIEKLVITTVRLLFWIISNFKTGAMTEEIKEVELKLGGLVTKGLSV